MSVSSNNGPGHSAPVLLAQILQALQGGPSSSGVQSIVAGTNVTIDNTDPKNPVVSATAPPPSNIIDGFTLSNLTNAQLDAYVFNNCTFLTADSSSGHPYNLTGTNTIYNGSSAQYIIGNADALELYVTNATGTFTLTGSSATIVPWSVTSGGNLGSSCTVTTTQTVALIGGISAADDGSATSICSATLNANSTLAYTCPGIGTGAANGSALAVNVTSAAVLDFSACALFGVTSLDSWTLTAGVPTSFIAPASINLSGNTDTWNGSWTDSAITNTILAAYAAGGGTSGTLTIGGASPTGQGIIDAATIIANGVTLTTN